MSELAWIIVALVVAVLGTRKMLRDYEEFDKVHGQRFYRLKETKPLSGLGFVIVLAMYLSLLGLAIADLVT